MRCEILSLWRRCGFFAHTCHSCIGWSAVDGMICWSHRSSDGWTSGLSKCWLIGLTGWRLAVIGVIFSSQNFLFRQWVQPICRIYVANLTEKVTRAEFVRGVVVIIGWCKEAFTFILASVCGVCEWNKWFMRITKDDEESFMKITVLLCCLNTHNMLWAIESKYMTDVLLSLSYAC